MREIQSFSKMRTAVESGSEPTFDQLESYKLAMNLAMQLFHLTQDFPREERFALTDQLRKASREVAAFIARSWGNRYHTESFDTFLMNAIGAIEESRSWLLFAVRCNYVNQALSDSIFKKYDGLKEELFQFSDEWRLL